MTLAQPCHLAVAHAVLAMASYGVSAVKATYKQLEQAQHPYDAEAIQSADAAFSNPVRYLPPLGLPLYAQPKSGTAGLASIAGIFNLRKTVPSHARTMSEPILPIKSNRILSIS
uniref:DUF641 domain-containing protein n=1 Tax=Oryza glumipatula TaxID=40148 RepID=A0A0E0BGU0_9ORYZ